MNHSLFGHGSGRRIGALLSCLGLGFALASLASAQSPAGAAQDADSIFFIQVSDTHWGFNNPKVNPDFAGTLKKGIAEINALQGDPDFLIFTGDETHTTADPAIRRQRMAQFKDMIAALKVQTIKFIPGEHDAALDNAQAYREFFGEPHYAFDLKGVHFIVLDNVSTPDGSLGEAQRSWLAGLLSGFDTDSQIIVFAHRPLIDVYPAWDWRTKDSALVLPLFKPFKNVRLFYGHIHQEREDAADGFTQYAAPGMMFPLPAPGSVASPNPLAWDAAHPYRGLGFRTVKLDLRTLDARVEEYAITPEGVLPSDAE
jgi:3',5'-cyclic AMP phosphodiesterase CpdA